MDILMKQNVVLKRVITGTEMESLHAFMCNDVEHTEDEVRNIEPQ